MKIVFCTNIWNHHQGPVCIELAKLLGDDFKLLLHQPLDHNYSVERIRLGWNLIPPDEPWIIGPPKECATADYSKYIQCAIDADVLILDSMVPYMNFKMLAERYRNGKLNFIMSERFFKKALPWWFMLNPRRWISWLIIHHRYEAAHVHYLTMGHWVKSDLDFYRVCKGRVHQWGYLTPVSETFTHKPERDKVIIGWCGRMLDWKQVNYILKAAQKLPMEVRSKCEIRLAGQGDAEDTLKTLAINLGVNNIVNFKGFMEQSKALEFLADLDVFVFPSGRYEGWGATLLEAMDKGCVPIANTAAGATLEVVKDGVNGFVFKDGDIDLLAKYLTWLIENPQERGNMGYNAWKTIQQWSPRAGANHLLEIVKGCK